jgi:hypothetical protein
MVKVRIQFLRMGEMPKSPTGRIRGGEEANKTTRMREERRIHLL